MPHAYKTSAEDVTDAVQAVARAGTICEFAVGRLLDAAMEAAELGLLKGSVGSLSRSQGLDTASPAPKTLSGTS